MKPSKSKSNYFAIGYLFSMAISTHLFSTLLLFCVSVKFELAIPFSPLRFTFLRVSLCGTILTWGRSQLMGACTTGLCMPRWKWRHRSQLNQAEALSRGMRVDHVYSVALKHACFHFINFITKCICVLAAFAQVKEVVNMNICCLFLSMCTLL